MKKVFVLFDMSSKMYFNGNEFFGTWTEEKTFAKKFRSESEIKDLIQEIKEDANHKFHMDFEELENVEMQSFHTFKK